MPEGAFARNQASRDVASFLRLIGVSQWGGGGLVLVNTYASGRHVVEITGVGHTEPERPARRFFGRRSSARKSKPSATAVCSARRRPIA